MVVNPWHLWRPFALFKRAFFRYIKTTDSICFSLRTKRCSCQGSAYCGMVKKKNRRRSCVMNRNTKVHFCVHWIRVLRAFPISDLPIFGDHWPLIRSRDKSAGGSGREAWSGRDGSAVAPEIRVWNMHIADAIALPIALFHFLEACSLLLLCSLSN